MSGICPDNLLLFVAKFCSSCRAPISEGNSPAKKLFSKEKDKRFWKFSIPQGILPVSLLLATVNSLRLLDIFAKELGSSPAKWLSLIIGMFNWVEFFRESKN